MKRHWQKAFIAALEQTGSVTQAAEAAGMGRSHVYHYKRTDAEFARLWEEALDMAADTLEDEARKRAFAGSDVLLMFLLKGLRPQKWRESRATIPPAELNKMIENELARIAKQKEVEALESVN
jgi:AcrR family transcriptional regulator